ncbi:unnamed protein product [Caenorhabditis brenneri]
MPIHHPAPSLADFLLTSSLSSSSPNFQIGICRLSHINSLILSLFQTPLVYIDRLLIIVVINPSSYRYVASTLLMSNLKKRCIRGLEAILIKSLSPL